MKWERDCSLLTSFVPMLHGICIQRFEDDWKNQIPLISEESDETYLQMKKNIKIKNKIGGSLTRGRRTLTLVIENH